MKTDKLPLDWLPQEWPRSPLAFRMIVLVTLRLVSSYSELVEKLSEYADTLKQKIPPGKIERTFQELINRNYLTKTSAKALEPTRNSLKFVDPKFSGANAGGLKHRNYVWRAALGPIAKGFYAYPDTGGGNIKLPDVLVLYPSDLDFFAEDKGYIAEIELNARNQSSRIVTAFNRCIRDYYAPLMLYVRDADVSFAKRVLTKKTKARLAENENNLKTCYVWVRPVSDLDLLNTIPDRASWFAEEPLNGKGAVRPKYPYRLPSIEDVGIGEYDAIERERNPDGREDNPIIQRRENDRRPPQKKRSEDDEGEFA